MGSSALTSGSTSRLALFWESSVGKKIVMGVTGVIMVGFLVAHMAGNLQFFLGREVFNKYGELLHTSEELLWVLRSVLIVSVALHITAAFQLTMRDRAARPVKYAKQVPQASTLASRVMRFGGLVILAFIPIHILNFTTGGLHPSFQQGDVYGNVLYAFKAWPLLAAFYVVAMVFTGLHLYHGAWAMLRTLGVAKPSANPLQRTVVKGIAWAVAIGFIIIPTTIVLGLVG
jgi:succinate dehydrogenase / fumarate reductase cytochrome b subunit